MKFDKSQFQYHGKYLTYGADRRFVARFKYGSKASFQAFLIKNFTVEEYFTLMATVKPGNIDAPRTYCPLEILELKGYINDNCKRACKHYGYPQTLAGFKKMIKDQVAERPKVDPLEVRRVDPSWPHAT
jgi:hypothetical protein